MIHYCLKCGAYNDGLSGYCPTCRKLLLLSPDRLGETLEIPEAAIVKDGKFISPYERESSKASELHNKFNKEHEVK